MAEIFSVISKFTFGLVADMESLSVCALDLFTAPLSDSSPPPLSLNYHFSFDEKLNCRYRVGWLFLCLLSCVNKPFVINVIFISLCVCIMLKEE